MRESKIVFGPNRSSYLVDEVTQELDAGRGSYIDQRDGVDGFRDKEHGMRFNEESLERLHKKDVIVVGGTEDAETHNAFKDLIFGLRMKHARSIHAVCTYFGWGRQEREGKEGEVARGLTRMYEICETEPTRLAFLDLHAPGIVNVGYPRIPELISTRPLYLEYIQENFNLSTIVPTSPDEGRTKYVRSFAKRLSTPHIVVPHVGLQKERPDEGGIKFHPVSVDFRQKIALLIDDLTSTGGTLRGAAETCKERNASRVVVMTPFVTLPGDAAQKLQDCPHIDEIIITNAHPRSQDPDIHTLSKFKVLSIAKLVAEEVKKYW